KGSVGRQGLLFYLLFVGESSPEEDKSAGSGFARCATTARRVAPTYPAYRNYPAHKAGAIVEPIRAKPTQSLTMNYPLHLLI
ncbi:hypothetical protein DNI83_06605, partial [Salmonella enterica subsp. salamae serovar Sofia]|nr:hypothetical protein [Salmonella enterica subsp. salamae serovar Sofia]EBV0228054.1 hypothetical protein [Salmonella enterica subsp. salamae serovar Sofia]